MLTAIVLTKNEEKNLRRCLESLGFCNEIIVIDDNSSDKTVQIAKYFNTKVFQRSLNDDFSAQRNFGLERASADWVLFIDADEEVSRQLAAEIIEKIKKEDISGFLFKRKDFIFNQEIKFGETSKVKLLRLAKKNSGEWQGKVHEVWKTKGKTGMMKNKLIHYPHNTVTEFLKEINFYSSLRAQELYGLNQNVNLWQIVVYPVAKFCQNYLLRLGFLDGMPGLIIAMMMSLHSFLVKGKLYLLRKNPKKNENI